MQIVENTALKFTIPAKLANAIYERVEKCEVIKDEMVLYWGHRETCTAASIIDEAQPDITLPKLPSPILKDYDWPGIYKPFDHQRDTASFLSIRQRAFCFNEAGTGKTSAAIWAADYLMKQGIIKKVLIICPLSIMYSAWQADIFRTAMHRTCGIAHGSAVKRKKILDEGYDFTIINYDGTSVILPELQQAKFDLIIVDEANAYKTVSTKR